MRFDCRPVLISPAADWRSGGERRRGWTGLRPEEVDVRTVNTIKGEEISSEEIRIEKVEAVLRVRYARSFPRVADRSLAIHAIEN